MDQNMQKTCVRTFPSKVTPIAIKARTFCLTGTGFTTNRKIKTINQTNVRTARIEKNMLLSPTSKQEGCGVEVNKFQLITAAQVEDLRCSWRDKANSVVFTWPTCLSLRSTIARVPEFFIKPMIPFGF
ncbi:hypothetical protein J6590_036963 [Homalodisca vitripennis]|nr:hypothetical protein J6590_036963 [Homalodisca vitripennis]